MKTIKLKNNFTIIEVKNLEEGSNTALKLIGQLVSNESLLLLSGGSSPKKLYKKIASDKSNKIIPGAVATVDERWGPPNHKYSNEKMMQETGIYRYMSNLNIEIASILHGILNMYEAAESYNILIQGLFMRFKNRIAVMGLGSDGHSAGLSPEIEKWKNSFVQGYTHKSDKWSYQNRITLTPKTIKQITTNIILVFGKEKYQALKRLLSPEIAKKNTSTDIYQNAINNYVVTDQETSSLTLAAASDGVNRYFNKTSAAPKS